MDRLKCLNNLDDIRLTKEFVFLNPYKFIAFFIYGIIFLLAAVCVFLSYTKKQETIDVQGVFQLSDKLQDVQVYVDGVVKEIHVQDRSYVEKGQPILSLYSDKLGLEKENLEKKLEETKEQINYLIRMEECIDKNKNTFKNNDKEGYYYAQVEKYLKQMKSINSRVSSSSLSSLQSQQKSLQELLNAMKKGGSLSSKHSQSSQLKIYKSKISEYDGKIKQAQAAIKAAKDPTSLAQYNQQLELVKTEKSSYAEQSQLNVQQQIDSLKEQITQVKNSNSDTEKQAKSEAENLKASSLVEVKSQRQQLQSTLDECEKSIASVNTDLSYYNVVASEAGYIRYKSDIRKDNVLSAGSVVGILTTEENKTGDFQVTLNVPSKGIGFVKGEQRVKITVDGLDRQDYGYIDGNVEKIYDTPIQLDGNTYYQVKTSVNIREEDTIYKDLFSLKDDMSVQANIITKETSWMTYLLQKMNIFKDEDKDKS